MSSDIHSVLVGELWRKASLVAKASGSAIAAGTVNYYLKALTGANAGKWWKNADQTWDVAETANAMTHQADGCWTITLAATPFADAIIYLEYAKESGDLHVAGEGRLLRGKAVVDAVNVVQVKGADAADTIGDLANAACDTAIETYNLDLLLNNMGTELDNIVDDGSVLGILLAISDVSAFDRTTDSLQAVRDRGDSVWGTATGFATPTNVTDAHTATDGKVDALETHGDGAWATATSVGLSDGAITAAKITADALAAAAFAPTFWQTAARLVHQAGGTVWYISKSGHDVTGDGTAEKPYLTVGAAIWEAAAGDTIFIGPGTYAQGAAVLAVPDGVALRGAGIGQTIITSTANLTTAGAIVKPGTGSVIEDLTVHGTLADGTSQAALGFMRVGAVTQTPPAWAIIRRCRLIADSDAVYMRDQDSPATPSLMVLENCQIESAYDGVVLQFGENRVVLKDCDVTVKGPSTCGTGPGDYASAVRTGSGTNRVTAHNCRLRASGANVENNCVSATDSGQTAVLIGCDLHAYGTNPRAIEQQNDAVVITAGCWFDPSLVVGTVTHVPPGAAILADTDALDGRLTAARATKLDNLDKGVAAAEAAIRGADGDTLKDLSDQVDAVETDTQDLQGQIGVAGAGLTAVGDARLANLDASVSSRSSHAAADVDTELSTSHGAGAWGGDSAWTAEQVAAVVGAEAAIRGADSDTLKTLSEQVDAVEIKTDLIGSGALTWRSPVNVDGDVELIQGDDYSPDMGTELTWSEADYSGALTADDTVELRLMTTAAYKAGTGTAALTKAGTLALAGTTLTATFALTTAEVATLTSTEPPDGKVNYTYQIRATKDGERQTLGIGSLTLKRNVP